MKIYLRYDGLSNTFDADYLTEARTYRSRQIKAELHRQHQLFRNIIKVRIFGRDRGYALAGKA